MNEPPPVNRVQPWHQLALDGHAVAAAARGRSRDRVTIDLRGIGARLHVVCAAQGMTLSAAVRSAVLSFLDSQGHLPPATAAAPQVPNAIFKLTLRLDTSHAAQLTERARASAVSRGAYIAALLDAVPPSPKSPDHRQAIASLVRSTQQIATISTDLNACLRLARCGSLPAETASVLTTLGDEVRLHLRTASLLLASLTAPPRTAADRDRVCESHSTER